MMIYKVCTSSYANFVAGNTYLSYNGFKFGGGYQNTGELGTDIYITNIRVYDITDGLSFIVNKTGNVSGLNFSDLFDVAEISSTGEGRFSDIVEN